MTIMSIQPLWLTHFIEILLVLELQIKKFIVGVFSYKAHFKPQISSNDFWLTTKSVLIMAADQYKAYPWERLTNMATKIQCRSMW